MDWDFDGKLDIVSGCYWTDEAQAGQIQLLKGKGEMDFAKSVSIKDGDGDPLENMKIEKSKNNSSSDAQLNVICTQQHVVDFDSDGDLDMVVGCFGKNFFYYENKGDAKSEPKLAKPIKLDISSPYHHAAPHLYDWDQDGDLDLLSGSTAGGVMLAENTGSRTKPKFEKFKQLVRLASKNDDEMSGSTRVWVTDFNRDGLPDLLVGDSARQVTRVAGVTDEMYEKKKAEYMEKMATAQGKMDKLRADNKEIFQANDPEKIDEKLRNKMNTIFEEMEEASTILSSIESAKSTGFVWVLLQKEKKVAVR